MRGCYNREDTRQTKVGKLLLANMLTNCWRQIELVSIFHQQFAHMFANCCCAFHTRQLEFANASLPTLVYRMKAALHNVYHHLRVHFRMSFFVL